MTKIKLKSLCDLSNQIEENYHIVDITLTQGDSLYLLIQEMKANKNDYEYLWEKLLPNYKIIFVEHGKTTEIFAIGNSEIEYHFVREIKKNILLASARCQYKSEEDIEENGRIFDRNGKNIECFTIGDGIEDIKVHNDAIWISYFDEGVYGNYGWSKPIGRDGLICLDQNRSISYSYKAEHEHEFIDDCYSMTLDFEGNPWFYYYSEFCLCYKNRSGLKYFKPNLSGSSNILVSDQYILMDKGYDNKAEFLLFSKNGFKELKSIEFVDEKDQHITSGFKYFNNSKGIILENNKVFLFDLSLF